jgi:hypothetical protein
MNCMARAEWVTSTSFVVTEVLARPIRLAGPKW